VPDGVDQATVRRRLLDEWDLEVGAGLGPLAGKVSRVGLMGYASRPENVLLCLRALAAALTETGHVASADAAQDAAEAQLRTRRASRPRTPAGGGHGRPRRTTRTSPVGPT
jgi:alanine-glyoxylate transaminase/serine-glyoxylate transaminase/serine-pyruvate transaminase